MMKTKRRNRQPRKRKSKRRTNRKRRGGREKTNTINTAVKKAMKKFKKENCSPKANDELGFTCYTSTALSKIKQIWNARHPDSLITTNNPREIWKQLKKYMGATCDRESCWLKHKCIGENLNKNIVDFTFAPKKPEEWKKKPHEWLSSVEISQIMRQYEHTYKCFEFLGPSPIDYDSHKIFGECVWEELCKFNLIDTIKRGKRKIGIIFNLDPHYKSGSHWVALFINTRKREIYYFDSYGEKIEKKIKEFAETVQEQSMKLGEKYELIENELRHQYTQSECGMYSLYVIVQLLKDIPFDKISTKKIPDKLMRELRKKWFN